MKFVIDTHTFLWLTSGDPQLSQTALDLLQDAESEIWLSEVSLWEIAIKMNIGKLTLSDAFEIFIAEQTAAYQIDILDVTLNLSPPSLRLWAEIPAQEHLTTHCTPRPVPGRLDYGRFQTTPN